MLELPHIKPLTKYAENLGKRGLGAVPYFDPMDGGINACFLFLLEKPGPKADISGFISRNNNDPTAEASFWFMQEAGINRGLVCMWNVIPGWNGTRKITGAELKSGVNCLNELFALLPELKAVMLVGQKAERARPLLNDWKLAILSSYHPSPINRATAPDKWRSIAAEWAKLLNYM